MKHNRKIMYGAGFLFTLSLGLVYYITSSFLASFVGEASVGLIYTLASLASFVALLLVPILLRRIGGYAFLLAASLYAALALVALAFAESSRGIVIVFILSFSANSLIAFALDEFLKIFSEERKIGSIRGLYLSVCHIALVGTQLAFWLGLGLYSFRLIFLSSAMVIFLLFFLLAFHLRNIPEPHYDRGHPLAYISHFFRKKGLARAYGLSFLLQLFYAWMIIYTPLYLSRHLGFSWQNIGLILSIMLVPFLFIPYRLGTYGDRFGERKMLMAGFGIASLATLLLFFVKLPLVWVWAFLLFFTRVGAASIEVMTDTYFFKHIRPENEEFIGVYRTAAPVAFVVGPLIASLAFLVIPGLEFLYVILSALMLLGVYLASTIRKDDR